MQDKLSISADMLDPPQRIALAYAPKRVRPVWEALLLLEQRLADAARPGRDPIMIQFRLAWWRDRLAEPAGQRPKGEPLLARLAAWDGQTAALTALVNGWEAKIVGEDGGAELARARTEAFVALGHLVGVGDTEAIRRAAQGLADPASAKPAPALPRAMRPLAVLRAMALRDARGGKPTPFADIARVMWVGLLGR
ncbi:hypothetical protein OVA07_12180 [Novosphingobium sp. SL115]|uniref:hypothetical protein n=1 Tax=Novosphingobium sp. SL115 TaxID=2995150 RepID=UPI0022726710|nr:hypothetical protein [Novosphingobium sp. SL115]MCY1671759.1 hypothetical protein [Novosphingobium sp. SL115]